VKLPLRRILDLRLAGARDNVSLLATVGGGALANPFLAGVPDARLAGAAITAAGAFMLGNRVLNTARHRVFTSTVDVQSHSAGLAADLSKDWGGMLLGYTSDSGKPLVIPWDAWMRHCFIIGQSGMGKTVLGEWMMFQQIMRGGGIIWIDGKIDADNIAKLNAMCAYAGRRDDLLVVNPDDPSMSNTYNPILYGDADEVASRIISLIPSAENNPGADHYRQSANQGVTTTVSAINATGRAYSFLDLSILLQSEEAMAKLEKLIPADSDAAGMYRLFLDRFKTPDRQGVRRLDMKKVADLFGGVGGRMFSFGEGNFGKITNTYTPDVRMYDDIVANKIIYIALPTMGKNESASQFGKMTIGDYRSAIAKIQHLSKPERPWPPTLGFFDEAGSYVTQAWARIFEQSRSAHQVLVPAVQTVANLDAVTKELREMVLGNTVTKATFRVGTEETAKTIADLIGKEQAATLSISAGGAAGGTSEAGTGAAKNVQKNQNMGYGERYEEVYRVPTDDLKQLGLGEAIVSTDGQKVYQVKIPRVTFDPAFLKKVGPFQVNRKHHPFVAGLRMFDSFGRTRQGGKSSE
jgi:hypothetical protein